LVEYDLSSNVQSWATFWLRYAIILAQVALYCAVLIPFLSDKVYCNAPGETLILTEVGRGRAENPQGKKTFVAQMLFKCDQPPYTCIYQQNVGNDSSPMEPVVHQHTG